jgi:hypothetical protein
MDGGTQSGVSVGAVVEVLAYLVSATRTQLDEAAEYAPMRMLTAAQRLAAALPVDAPPAVHAFATALRDVPPTATPSADPEAYKAIIDGLCAALADCLLSLEEPTTTPGVPPPSDAPSAP